MDKELIKNVVSLSVNYGLGRDYSICLEESEKLHRGAGYVALGLIVASNNNIATVISHLGRMIRQGEI